MEPMKIALVGFPSGGRNELFAWMVEKKMDVVTATQSETLAEVCALSEVCPRDINMVVLAISIEDALAKGPEIQRSLELNRPDYIALVDIHKHTPEDAKRLRVDSLSEYTTGIAQYLERFTGRPVKYLNAKRENNTYRTWER